MDTATLYQFLRSYDINQIHNDIVNSAILTEDVKGSFEICFQFEPATNESEFTLRCRGVRRIAYTSMTGETETVSKNRHSDSHEVEANLITHRWRGASYQMYFGDGSITESVKPDITGIG